MSDKRFDEVVDSDGLRGVQPDLHYRSLCKECGEHSEVYKREWRQPILVDKEEMKYVADMRAWNCCMADEEPLDGFPDDPR
jgi:hypothetical protein